MAMNIVSDKNSLERVEVCCVLEIVIDKFQMVSGSTTIKMNYYP
jgi:hypothetical protein